MFQKFSCYCPSAQMAEFMFLNVAYWATVYITGIHAVIDAKKMHRAFLIYTRFPGGIMNFWWYFFTFAAFPEDNFYFSGYFKLLKVAFSQKRLMRLSFLQADKPNYFPELEFWIFFRSKWLKSCQIRTWSCSNAIF